VVKGSLSLYAPRGSYQIVITHLQYEGVGDLLIKLHELKQKLQNKGYFDPAHKKPLPKYPKTIGVVTSPTGAVIHDILTVLQRRFHGFHLILNPVKVQGAGAEQEIAQAILDFNRFKLADVLIVGRGGGSLEDLWAFNEECVIEAIFASEIPIISSVGHETDVSLADFAADVRASTPSAAAEIVIKEKSLQLEFLAKAKKMTLYHMSQLIEHHRFKLKNITKRPLFNSSEVLLAEYVQKMDEISSTLDQALQHKLSLYSLKLLSGAKQLRSVAPDRRLQVFKEKNITFQKGLDHRFNALLQTKKAHIAHLEQLLQSLNPRTILKKGYCIPFSENKSSVIISSKQLKVGDSICLHFHDGEVTTSVT
jgi:exodeoxyribonuclease VII large subunit